MTILEKYQEDLEYNSYNPLFAPYDDIVFGKRLNGRFQIESSNDKYGLFIKTIFDNGHHYLYSLSSRTLYEGTPLPPMVFIRKYVEKAIFDTISQHSNCAMPKIYCDENEIETIESNPLLVIRVLINHEEKIVRITNLLIQNQYRRNGYGKQLIHHVYQICKQIGYKLWLTEVTPHFYDSLVNRGAKIIENGEIVEIKDGTKLN